MYVPGLNPFWAIAESEHCQARQELAALRTELAAAKQRAAELEGKCKQERIAYMKAMKALRDFYDNLLSERTRTSCSRDYHMEERLEQIKKEPPALLPADRITHIPGKEDDDAFKEVLAIIDSLKGENDVE